MTKTNRMSRQGRKDYVSIKQERCTILFPSKGIGECKCHCHHYAWKDFDCRTCSKDDSCSHCQSKGERDKKMGLPKVKRKLINIKKFVKLANKIRESEKIEKLAKHRGVKLSSTLAGQRELIREIRNKINEIIERLNNEK